MNPLVRAIEGVGNGFRSKLMGEGGGEDDGDGEEDSWRCEFEGHGYMVPGERQRLKQRLGFVCSFTPTQNHPLLCVVFHSLIPFFPKPSHSKDGILTRKCRWEQHLVQSWSFFHPFRSFDSFLSS